MVGCSRGSLPTWMTAAAARVDLSGGVTPSHQGPSSSSPSSGPSPAAGADQELGMYERAFSAAGAAFVSAIIVNPLDVAKVGSSGHSLAHADLSSPSVVCLRFGV
jgi:solute carrier family 25, member 39/40